MNKVSALVFSLLLVACSEYTDTDIALAKCHHEGGCKAQAVTGGEQAYIASLKEKWESLPAEEKKGYAQAGNSSSDGMMWFFIGYMMANSMSASNYQYRYYTPPASASSSSSSSPSWSSTNSSSSSSSYGSRSGSSSSSYGSRSYSSGSSSYGSRSYSGGSSSYGRR